MTISGDPTTTTTTTVDTRPSRPAAPDERCGVVVITHERRDELRGTLARLRALTEQPQIVVVDNASSDGTDAMVRAEFPEVVLIEPGVNLGAVGRNVGAAALQTPYVAFCDDDTWYDDGALRRGADLLDAHPNVALINAGIMVEPDGCLDPICAEMAASPLPRSDGLPGAPLLSFLAGVSIVRRSAFFEVGGFSPRLWLGGEEELLGCDLAQRGWDLVYVADLVAHHQASKARDAHLRRRHGIRNTLWFAWLRRPLFPAVRRTAMMARVVPKDRVSLLGFLDAVAGISWVVRERRPVPPAMEAGYRSLERVQMGGGTRRYVS